MVAVLEDLPLGGQFWPACCKYKIEKLLIIFLGLKCPPCISRRELFLFTGEEGRAKGIREGECAENLRMMLDFFLSKSFINEENGWYLVFTYFSSFLIWSRTIFTQDSFRDEITDEY